MLFRSHEARCRKLPRTRTYPQPAPKGLVLGKEPATGTSERSHAFCVDSSKSPAKECATRRIAMASVLQYTALLAAAASAFAPRPGVLKPAPRLRRCQLHMSMFDRFKRVAEANINNVLGKMEDPEKVLNQAVEDLQKDLVTIRQSYAEVMATQKRQQRQKDQADQLADEWYRRAQLALEKSDDELAREALSRKQQQVDADRKSVV